MEAAAQQNLTSLTNEQKAALQQRLLSLRGPRNPKNPIEWVAEKKVGPNEKCPCGTGKKYKKCCGQLG